MPYTHRGLTAFMLVAATFLGCDRMKEKPNTGIVKAQTPSLKGVDVRDPAGQDVIQYPEDGDAIRYTRELVMKKARDVFPGEDILKIMSILDDYGLEPYERERERVQVAILKLSDGEIKKLPVYVREAKEDYRDTLGYAEYPLEMRSDPSETDPSKLGEIRRKDRKQYLEWLKGKPR